MVVHDQAIRFSIFFQSLDRVHSGGVGDRVHADRFLPERTTSGSGVRTGRNDSNSFASSDLLGQKQLRSRSRTLIQAGGMHFCMLCGFQDL